MIQKILTVLFVVVFSTKSIYAQEETIKKQNYGTKHSLGLAAGLSTGVGISYRYIPKRFGVQLTASTFWNSQFEVIDGGVTFLYKLKSKPKSMLFLYQGNHAYASTNVMYEQPTELMIMNGLGIGIELVMLKSIGLNILGGFLIQNTNYLGNPYFGADINLGLYYKF